ncbi:hypothetical protein [Pseudomonas sp. NFACC07-1]|uniref:hypothetical protein n=1 Tax=Pseudomonas sp. NFACC07-1 TaxID=1566239 RepID=UPI000B81C2C0|nr:hypothetical protein [Pseudomonas sp. NFACC07-1]
MSIKEIQVTGDVEIKLNLSVGDDGISSVHTFNLKPDLNLQEFGVHEARLAVASQLKLAKLESARLKLQIQKLRLQKLRRESEEVKPTFVELFHDISIKVGQKEIQDFLEVHRRDTEESIRQVVQTLSPTKH